ncbi:MAG: choice-of-anchor D domain-containing protein [Terriglobales bacterium]
MAYANCQRIDIRKSTNGGVSGFTLKETGIVAGDDTRTQFIPPMIGDGNPQGQNNVYFGTFRVYQSKTALESWSIVSNDLTGGVSTITNMAIAPSDRGVLYVGTNNGKVARGAGLTTLDCATLLTCFTDVTGAGLLPERRISAIGVSETNPNLVYVTIAGFGSGEVQGNSKHVFRSTTGGTNWTNISSDLPNISVNDIAVDPDIPGTLYVGTDVGVFRSTNDGVSWSTLANGLPRVAVFGLKLHRPTRTLRAATHGRGFWDLFVSTTTSPQLTLTPGTIVFGEQLQNTTSASRTLTITALNNDVTGLNVSAATGDFVRTNNCGTTVTANSTCTVGITFTPTGGGPRNGAFTLTSSGLGSPQTVNLTGMSSEVFVAQPDALTFKAVIGWTASDQAVTFTNNSGGSVTVSNVTVSGDYTRTHNCTTLANGANCNITIGFLPAAGGARNGTLTITHTGTGSPKTVALSGTGVEFTLSLARPQRPSRTSSGSVAVPQGQTATFDLVLGASASTDDLVDLQCVDAPRNATCTVMPTRLPLQSNEQAVRVTITTTAPRASRLSRVSASASGTPLGVHRVQIRARVGQATRDLPLEIQVLPRPHSIRPR